MNNKVKTQEIAKNLEAEVHINCTVCQKTYRLSECLKEEPMPAPYETVLEGFLVCPSCGDRKHSYYLSEHIRFQQAKLARAVQRWHETRNPRDWTTYKNMYKTFQEVFENSQKKYQKIFGKETSGEPGG